MATAWNPDVAPDEEADGYAVVSVLAVFGSTVYLGGYFDRVGGKARNNLVAIDATTGAVTPWNLGTNGLGVDTLALSGSTLYVGGLFTSVGGQDRNNLAAIDATTGAVTAWNPDVAGEAILSTGGFLSLAGVRALAVSGSTVYVGADFDPDLHSPGFIAVDAITGLIATPGQ